jgi:hypothetical protein
MKKTLRIALLLSVALILAFSTATLAFAQTGTGGDHRSERLRCEYYQETYDNYQGNFGIVGAIFLGEGNLCVNRGEDGRLYISSEFYGYGVVCFELEPGDDGSNAIIAIQYPEIGTSYVTPVIYTDPFSIACANVGVNPTYKLGTNPLVVYLINE